MSSFSLSGGVEVLGFISPTDTSDEYAVIDPLYGIDGLRNVASLSELNAITSLRRRSGMVVGINNGSQYYKLNPPPWNGTISDWSIFNSGVFTGGTVTGNTVFTNNLSASVFSAATYLNLPIDNTVTGGTYNPSNGSVTFVNNTGGTFTVTGFITGFTDIRVTGYTYSNNTFTIFDSSGNTFSATINTMTGLTVNGLLSATTISASTYQNLPITTLTVNSTPISGGTPNGVLFQSPTNVLSANDGFVYSGTFPNNFVGINSPTPIYSLDVNGAIYQRTGELLITSSGGVNKEGPFIASSGGTNRTTQLGILDNSTVPVGIDMFETNNSFPSSYINFRVNNADLVRMSGSFVGIGTTTDAGFRLDVNGTARIQNQLTTTGSITASSGTSRGTFLNQTLVAAANNDTLYALDITPSFTTGSFTGVTSVPLRIRNSSGTGNAFFVDGIGNGVLAGSLSTPTVYNTNNINLSSGSGNLSLQTNFAVNTGLVMFNSTRNIVIQNGGTFTDAGYRLDVIGTARISGATQILSSLNVTGNLFGTFYSSTGGFSSLIANYDTGVGSVTNNYTGFGVTRPFNPSGGVTTYDGFRFNATINQTGGASGTTRGLYIIPTLTSAFDFRAIETTVGNVMLNTVSGNTLIGTSTNSIYKLDVSGSTRVRGNTIISATTSTASGSTLTVVGSGSTQPIFTVQGSSGELFSVTDSLIGSLFSVNDISGLPILEVFSNNTVLMGTYLAPSLNTTSRVTANSGTTTVYTIPQSAYTGAFFEYTVSDGTNLRAGNIMSIWSGVTVNFMETQTTDIGSTSAISFTMSANTSNVVLQTSATTNNWTVKTIIRSI
jgi:hypothetical protein